MIILSVLPRFRKILIDDKNDHNKVGIGGKLLQYHMKNGEFSIIHLAQVHQILQKNEII